MFSRILNFRNSSTAPPHSQSRTCTIVSITWDHFLLEYINVIKQINTHIATTCSFTFSFPVPRCGEDRIQFNKDNFFLIFFLKLPLKVSEQPFRGAWALLVGAELPSAPLKIEHCYTHTYTCTFCAQTREHFGWHSCLAVAFGICLPFYICMCWTFDQGPLVWYQSRQQL